MLLTLTTSTTPTTTHGEAQGLAIISITRLKGRK